MTNSNNKTSESLLYLTDSQLRQGIEAMFFAYRGFTADPDRILDEYGYGRAHHRAMTNQGRELQERLSSAQSNRMRKAFKNAGPNAVSGFKTVLEAMMDPELNKIYSKLREEGK